MVAFNPFYATGFFLYLMKTSVNLYFFISSGGCRKKSDMK